MAREMRLEDFENPISGRTDSIFKASTWWSYILGFAVLVIAFGLATTLVASAKGLLGNIIPKGLNFGGGIPGMSVQPKPANPGTSGGLVVLQ